jgi:hypothetical protein
MNDNKISYAAAKGHVAYTDAEARPDSDMPRVRRLNTRLTTPTRRDQRLLDGAAGLTRKDYERLIITLTDDLTRTKRSLGLLDAVVPRLLAALPPDHPDTPALIAAAQAARAGVNPA